VIEKTQTQLSPISEKLAYLYDKLAASRRNPEAPDNSALALEISTLKAEQHRLQNLIVTYRAQRRQAEDEFNAEQARLTELLGLSS